jgi:hypothetical protein
MRYHWLTAIATGHDGRTSKSVMATALAFPALGLFFLGKWHDSLRLF